MDLVDIWPLFGLEIETPRLLLRPLRDDELPELVQAALDGIHDAGPTPFAFPWTDAPADELPRNLAQYEWSLRNRVSPANWAIPFAVHLDGRVIGMQDLTAHDFANRKTVESGSWITQSAQGQGIGTEMRQGLLQFAFDTLGADWAESGAAEWNERSLGVSAKLGYTPNGIYRVSPRPGEPVDEIKLRLARDEFIRPEWQARVRGAEAALRQLGVTA